MLKDSDQKTEKKRCLLILLGDQTRSLQAIMALSAAKQLYPQVEFSVLTSPSSESYFRRIPWIQEIKVFPFHHLKTLPRKIAKDWVKTFFASYQSKPFDLLFNWTYSEPSSFLSMLIPSKVKLGYLRKKDQSLWCSDGWSRYVHQVIESSIPQNIHWVDMLTTQILTAFQIHLEEPSEEAGLTLYSKKFFTQKHRSRLPWLEKAIKWVGIDLSLVHPESPFSTLELTELLSMMIADDPKTGFIFFGKKEDHKVEQEILDQLSLMTMQKPLLYSMIDQNEDFDALQTTLSRCQWLWTARSSKVLLCSLLGTRVFYFGSKKDSLENDAPYGNGHYLIQPRSFLKDSSKAKLPLLVLFETWKLAHQDWRRKQHTDLEYYLSKVAQTQSERVKVYRSRIRGSQDGGGVMYEALTSQPMSFPEWYSMTFGDIARAWYCGWTPKTGQDLPRSRVSPALLNKIRELRESLDAVEKIIARGQKLSFSFQKLLSEKPGSHLMSLEKKASYLELEKECKELQGLYQRLSLIHDPLEIFSKLHESLCKPLSPQNIKQMKKEHSIIHSQFQEALETLKSWCAHTLQTARPTLVAANVTPLHSRKPTQPELF